MHLPQMLIQVVLPREALLTDSAAKATLHDALGTIEFVNGAWEMGFHVAVEVERAGELAGASGVDADVWGWF